VISHQRSGTPEPERILNEGKRSRTFLTLLPSLRHYLFRGSFGAAWMRKPWSGAGFFRGSGHVWLGAAYRPPARGVLRQFAHFGATSGSFRLRATAVASRRSDLAKAPGTVSEDGDRDCRDENEKLDEEPESQAREAASERRLHRRRVSIRNRKKPIGRCSQKSALPGL
jgi:hypothetical protein